MAEQTQQRTPTRSRPQFPEGFGLPEDSEGMFAWEELREPLETAQLYWVATVRPEGRPHAVPLWGMWLNNTFYFELNPGTRRERNLDANPEIVVHLERGNLAIIVEGRADYIKPDAALDTQLADAFEAKYNYRPELGQDWRVVHPRVVLAWDTFPTSPTRFRFNTEA